MSVYNCFKIKKLQHINAREVNFIENTKESQPIQITSVIKQSHAPDWQDTSNLRALLSCNMLPCTQTTMRHYPKLHALFKRLEVNPVPHCWNTQGRPPRQTTPHCAC